VTGFVIEVGARESSACQVGEMGISASLSEGLTVSSFPCFAVIYI
jgi:hypothetical protein